MNTKKISELNIAENVSEGMNVVVEDNGQTKRFPASKIVTSVNGKSGDVELEPGVKSDWNENDETSLSFVKNRPFYKSTSIKEIASATGTVSSGGYLYISSDNPGFISGAEYTVNINGTEEVIVAEYHVLSGYVQLTGSNFYIYPSSSKYVFYSTNYSTIEITISITGPVEEIVKIDTDFIPESIARKDYIDSRLPSYSRDDYKGTFVVNSDGHLEVQRYNYDYLTNKPFGKLDGYEPVVELSLNTTDKTFEFVSGSNGSKEFLLNKHKYWVVDRSSGVSWLGRYDMMTTYDIYTLTISASDYPDAPITKFDFATNTYTTNNDSYDLPGIIYVYNEGEWGTKMMDETYIPSTIQRVGGDIIVPSSTPDSTKKFKITVDDTGTISATEVTS